MSDTIAARLKNHPKLLAKLFMVMMLLSQAGSAVAASGGTIR
ncbi:MAG: hypothetical protein ABEJ68_05055 [Halobacteriaceae archaeon]